LSIKLQYKKIESSKNRIFLPFNSKTVLQEITHCQTKKINYPYLHGFSVKISTIEKGVFDNKSNRFVDHDRAMNTLRD